MRKITPGKSHKLLRAGSAVLAALFLVVSSCASYPRTPEAVVRAFGDALASGDYEKYISYLAESDRRNLGFVQPDLEIAFPRLSEVARRSDFFIVSSAVNGSAAVVTERVSEPDLRELDRLVTEEYLAISRQRRGVSPDALYDPYDIQRYIEDGVTKALREGYKYTMRDRISETSLRLEGGFWRIYWGLERAERK